MIRRAMPSDLPVITRLAHALWPHDDADDLSDGFASLLTSPDAAVFLWEQDGTAVGFAQCQIRHDYVEGTEGGPVGYLEGVYVAPDARRQGLARGLVQACEDWSAAQGCRAFASDCELTNTVSQAFHRHIGFREVNRVVCYVKDC